MELGSQVVEDYQTQFQRLLALLSIKCCHKPQEPQKIDSSFLKHSLNSVDPQRT